jgi:hypothetical protein
VKHRRDPVDSACAGRLGALQGVPVHVEEVDVLLSPVAFTQAFPHDHSEPWGDRVIATSAGPRRYAEMLYWIAHATVTGWPATAAPVELTKEGLPVGMAGTRIGIQITDPLPVRQGRGLSVVPRVVPRSTARSCSV